MGTPRDPDENRGEGGRPHGQGDIVPSGSEIVVRTNRTPDGDRSLSTVVMHLEEGSHWVVRGVNERRPAVSWARKRAVAGVLAPAAVLRAQVCRGTRSSHRGGSGAEVEILLRWPSRGADGLPEGRVSIET